MMNRRSVLSGLASGAVAACASDREAIASPRRERLAEKWDLFSPFQIGKVTSLQLEIHENVYNVASHPARPLNTTTTDSAILKRVALLGSFRPFRKANPRESGGGSGADLGELQLATDKRSWTIYLGVLGFCFDTGSQLHELFYSWILAHVVDDIYFQETKLHLPQLVITRLSGERDLETEKKVYYESFGRSPDKSP